MDEPIWNWKSCIKLFCSKWKIVFAYFVFYQKSTNHSAKQGKCFSISQISWFFQVLCVKQTRLSKIIPIFIVFFKIVIFLFPLALSLSLSLFLSLCLPFSLFISISLGFWIKSCQILLVMPKATNVISLQDSLRLFLLLSMNYKTHNVFRMRNLNLRWEFIKENKKIRKQERALDQESVQEKINFLFFLIVFLVELSFSLFFLVFFYKFPPLKMTRKRNFVFCGSRIPMDERIFSLSTPF